MDDDDRLMMSLPKQQTTVSAVSSLDDRRRILALESQVGELESRLAAALRTAQPTMTIDRTGCRHYGGTEVDDDSPLIRCKECGAKLDPYAVLRRIAHQEVNFCYGLNGLREERDRLAKEVEQLKAKRSALARKVRRGKDAPPAGLAERMRSGAIGTLVIARIGKTPEWTVEAVHEKARAEAGPRWSLDGADASGYGPLEDALESVLAAMEAASGGQERAPEVAPAASPQQETSNRRNDATTGDLAPDPQGRE